MGIGHWAMGIGQCPMGIKDARFLIRVLYLIALFPCPMPHALCPDYRYCAKVLVKVVLGTAPTTVSTCRPSLNTNSVGMLRIP